LEYNNPDIAKIVGQTERTIKNWTDLGYVVPDIRPSKGRGVERIFSEINLIQFQMIVILSKDCKTDFNRIGSLMRLLREKEIFNLPVDFYNDSAWGRKRDILTYWIRRPGHSRGGHCFVRYTSAGDIVRDENLAYSQSKDPKGILQIWMRLVDHLDGVAPTIEFLLPGKVKEKARKRLGQRE